MKKEYKQKVFQCWLELKNELDTMQYQEVVSKYKDQVIYEDADGAEIEDMGTMSLTIYIDKMQNGMCCLSYDNVQCVSEDGTEVDTYYFKQQYDKVHSQKSLSDTFVIKTIVDELDKVFEGKVSGEDVYRMKDKQGNIYYDTATMCYHIHKVLDCGRHAVAKTYEVYAKHYTLIDCFADDEMLSGKWVRIVK